MTAPLHDGLLPKVKKSIHKLFLLAMGLGHHRNAASRIQAGCVSILGDLDVGLLCCGAASR